MLQLFYETHEERFNSTFAVRWCISPADIAKLQSTKATHLHVLIVVKYDNGHEDRQCRALEESMTYVRLRYPGKHVIFASLIGKHEECERKEVLQMRAYYLTEDNAWTGYLNEVLVKRHDQLDRVFLGSSVEIDPDTYMGLGRDNLDPFLCGVEPTEPQEIVVPKEFFAKEAPQWLKRWTNLWYQRPPIDQCQFRKRLIVSILFQPVLVPLYIFLMAIFRAFTAMMFLIVGMRGVSIRPVWHPFRDSVDDVLQRVTLTTYESESPRIKRDNWFFTKQWDQRWHRWLLPLYPPVWLLIAYIIQQVAKAKHRTFWAQLKLIGRAIWYFFVSSSTHHNHFIYWTAAVVVVVGVLIGYCMHKQASSQGTSLTPWQKWVVKWKQRSDKRFAESRRLARDRRVQEEARLWQEIRQTVSCSTDSKVPSLHALPKGKLYIRLRFLNLKAKFCKPFAG